MHLMQLQLLQLLLQLLLSMVLRGYHGRGDKALGNAKGNETKSLAFVAIALAASLQRS